MTSPPPQRILSLLPGATELVVALGLGDRLVGISHECDYPSTVTTLPRVTRTTLNPEDSSLDIDEAVRAALADGRPLYALDATLLARLAPDLVITQALCELCAVADGQVERELRLLPVQPQRFNLEPRSLADLLSAVTALGELTGVPDRAAGLRHALSARIDTVRRRSQAVVTRPRVAFLEWIEPWFAGGHWNPELVTLAGGEPVVGVAGEPSRTLSDAALAAAGPEVIFIAACGLPVARALEELESRRRSASWQTLRAVQTGRVYVTDGNAYYNRSGPRLVDSLEQLAHSLHPALHPLPATVPAACRLAQAV